MFTLEEVFDKIEWVQYEEQQILYQEQHQNGDGHVPTVDPKKFRNRTRRENLIHTSVRII